MRASEILRSLIDIIAQEEETELSGGMNIPYNTDTTAPTQQSLGLMQPAFPEDSEEEIVSDETGIFVPPLQQKLELMKKAQGVESVYDEEPEEDELEVMKRAAGIMSIFTLDDDEPFQE